MVGVGLGVALGAMVRVEEGSGVRLGVSVGARVSVGMGVYVG